MAINVFEGKFASFGSSIAGNVRPPRLFVISHQLSASGAPMVAVDMAEELRTGQSEVAVEFLSFLPTDPGLVERLNKVGVVPTSFVHLDTQLLLQKGDVIILHSTGYSEKFRESIFQRVEDQTVKKLLWFIHEDVPERYFNEGNIKRFQAMLDSGRMEMFLPSLRTRDKFRRHLDRIDTISKEGIRCRPPYERARAASEFDEKLTFVLTGAAANGNKGQLPVLYAFIAFQSQFYQPNPDAYRDFELVFVGLGSDNLSEQIRMHGENDLIGRFRSHGLVPHQDCLQIVLDSHITICNSLSESLGLSVFEGMFAGHPILRNGTSGCDEQLEDGKNGYYFDSSRFGALVSAIERILNRQKTPDETLEAMSARSLQIALEQTANNYGGILGAAIAALQ